MRTRRARLANARPNLLRQTSEEVSQPFKVNNVSAEHLGQAIQRYLLSSQHQAVNISGDLTLQPVEQEKPSEDKSLSVDVSWHLKLQQAVELSKDLENSSPEKQLLLQRAIAKYHYLAKRNL